MTPDWVNRIRPRVKSGCWGRDSSQMAIRRAVTWSMTPPRLSAAARPSLIRRSYRARSRTGAVSRRIGACPGPAGRDAAGSAGAGGDGEELLEVLASDEAPSADLPVGQVAYAHLVVEQVAGQAGQASRLVDGVGQPFGCRVWLRLAGTRRRRSAGGGCSGAGATAWPDSCAHAP